MNLTFRGLAWTCSTLHQMPYIHDSVQADTLDTLMERKTFKCLTDMAFSVTHLILASTLDKDTTYHIKYACTHSYEVDPAEGVDVGEAV